VRSRSFEAAIGTCASSGFGQFVAVFSGGTAVAAALVCPGSTRIFGRTVGSDPAAAYPATGDGHRSFSASSRNSSGTEREIPSTTEPYPIGSHPERSRILSTARSAAQRALATASSTHHSETTRCVSLRHAKMLLSLTPHVGQSQHVSAPLRQSFEALRAIRPVE